MKPKLS